MTVANLRFSWQIWRVLIGSSRGVHTGHELAFVPSWEQTNCHTFQLHFIWSILHVGCNDFPCAVLMWYFVVGNWLIRCHGIGKATGFGLSQHFGYAGMPLTSHCFWHNKYLSSRGTDIAISYIFLLGNGTCSGISSFLAQCNVLSWQALTFLWVALVFLAWYFFLEVAQTFLAQCKAERLHKISWQRKIVGCTSFLGITGLYLPARYGTHTVHLGCTYILSWHGAPLCELTFLAGTDNHGLHVLSWKWYILALPEVVLTFMAFHPQYSRLVLTFLAWYWRYLVCTYFLGMVLVVATWSVLTFLAGTGGSYLVCTYFLGWYWW